MVGRLKILACWSAVRRPSSVLCPRTSTSSSATKGAWARSGARLPNLPTYLPSASFFFEKGTFFVFVFDDVHWHVCLHMNIASDAHVTLRLKSGVTRRGVCRLSHIVPGRGLGLAVVLS